MNNLEGKSLVDKTPFDLERAKRGEKVVTRDGIEATFKSVVDHPLSNEYPLLFDICGKTEDFAVNGRYWAIDGITDPFDLFMASAPDRTFPEVIEDYHAKRRLVDKHETEPSEVIKFLLGEAPLDGHWFGSSHPTGAPFWWRHKLRKEISEPKEEISEEAVKILKLAIQADAFDKNLGYDFFGRLNEWRRKTGF